jgi:methionyl-tRNA formyltransferase
MKVVIVSKDNFWTQELINNLYSPNIEFIWVSILSEKYIENINPDWIFFFHWSEIVSNNIFEKYKCAVIHTGNLPKDRGGSPIQNQILNRINNTRVNIIEMKETIDSGGVYCSYPITLQGNLTDIWLTIAKTSAKLISKCISENPKPQPQKGTPQIYKRIKNNEIKFDKLKDLSYIYDQIRMVDDNSYPNPYLDINGYRLEFSRAKLENEKIITDVKITKK